MKCAAVAYIKRYDGKILVVWNKRYGGWTLPGGMVEEDETAEEAVARELVEETGLQAISSRLIYSGAIEPVSGISDRGNYVYVFQVDPWGSPKEIESGCPITWFSREEFLRWSPFTKFYSQLFTSYDL